MRSLRRAWQRRHVALDEQERLWDEHARGETETQRLDRNWTVLVQELRVLQTGVQILAGFLLIVPFQSRFDVLHGAGVAVYLATVGAALLAVAFLLAPIAEHRVLFRHHSMHRLVATTHRDAMSGLACLAVALGGAAAIVVLATTESAWGAGLAALLVALVLGRLWLWIPLRTLAEATERAERAERKERTERKGAPADGAPEGSDAERADAERSDAED